MVDYSTPIVGSAQEQDGFVSRVTILEQSNKQTNAHESLEGSMRIASMIVLSVILTLSLVACSGRANEATQTTNTPSHESAHENVSAPEKPESVSEVTTTVGERTNPVPLGESITTEYVRFTYNNEVVGYTMRVSEMLRGDEAMQLALSWNQFNNRDFPEGKDLILVKVEFTLNKYSSNDENDPEWLASSIHFDFFNGDYSEVSEFISVVVEPHFFAKLFEGASTSGWIYTVADRDDQRPSMRHDDRIWFALY